MSAINPKREEFVERDHYTVAKDVAWVIRALWGGVVVVGIAAFWAAALASDVEQIKKEVAKDDVRELADNVVQKNMSESLVRIEERQRNLETKITAMEAADQTQAALLAQILAEVKD